MKALILDVDGTIAETEEAHRKAFNQVFTESKLAWHWDRGLYGKLLLITGGKERIRYFVRNFSPPEANRFIANDDLITDMHLRKTEIYMQLVSTGEVPLRPGIARLIDEAHRHDVTLAISTTTNQKPLEALFAGTLGANYLPSKFAAIAAGDVVKNKKPAPDLYNLVLGKLGLAGSECLAIEDSENGLRSAMAADIPTIITVSEYSSGQDFSGAIKVVKNLDEPVKLGIPELKEIFFQH
jgi:HAD superfamily hydrolase (TIGR01509 family)